MKQDSVISLLNSFLGLNFDVLHTATNNRYADGNDIRFLNSCPIALFSIYKLTNISGKHLEGISHSHKIPLMYKLITSAKHSDDSSIGFDRERGRRKDEKALIKNIKGKYYLRIMLKDIFRFAEHREEANYGLGYKITST